jgi:hypothetical protein
VLEDENEEFWWELSVDGDQAIACIQAGLDQRCLMTQISADVPAFWELELADFLLDGGETCGAC